ncbi:MAG: ABC transporter ATP-binding protein [Alphaproteobacteria bacterium]|nr:ABC transporter ATP-binding protein [Alphaproteobacteria bacterium]
MTDSSHPLLIQGIRKSFGSKQVLDGIDFALNPREIFGLIGLNGAGKTTLIKIILGLLGPDAGGVQVSGCVPTDIAARRHYNYLPEKFHPSPYLTGHEFLSLALAYHGLPYDPEIGAAMCASLDFPVNYIGQRVGSYSKGMGQKLGLASVLLSNAPLLILDEPMSGLDPLARIRLKEQLLQARAQGRTVFFSSHILADIDEICDRIAVIHATKLVFLGTPKELKERYGKASLEMAFLGSIEKAA